MSDRPVIRWAVKWRENNKLDGKREYFVWNYDAPRLFTTREKATLFIKREYGFIRTRADLQREPYGWKMPIAVKVEVVMREIKKGRLK